MTSEASSSLVTHCKVTCNAGTYLASSGSTCSACLGGYYCGGGTYYYNTSSNQGITACPTGMTSEASSSLVTHCKVTCNAGAYLAMNGTTCSTCVSGYYCGGGTYNYNTSSDQGINKCPDAYPETASTGSSVITQCRKGTECSQSDCNHTGCTAGGTYPIYGSCSRTDCHDGCTVSGKYTTYKSNNCTKDDCSKKGCTCTDEFGCYISSGPVNTSGKYCPAGCLADAPDSCPKKCYKLCKKYSGKYYTVLSSNNSCTVDTAASYTTCSCTGSYVKSSGNCDISNAGSYSTCTCSGRYYTYYQ
jgi:hypothetical protein